MALIVVAGVALMIGTVGVLPNSFAFGGNELRFSANDVSTVESILRENDVPAASIAEIMRILESADPHNSAVDDAREDANEAAKYEDTVLARLKRIPGAEVKTNYTIQLGEGGGSGRPPIVDALVQINGRTTILEVVSSASTTQIEQVIRRVERVRKNPEFADARVVVVAPDEGIASAVRARTASRAIDVISDAEVETSLSGE